MPGHAKRLRLGHPWAYSNELRMDDEAKALAPGTVVRVVDAGREVLGCATFNPHSLIALRMLARQSDTDIDAGFFRDRLSAARDLRDRLVKAPHYRLIHAEADNLPGLAIDRFGDVFVCQVNSAGMERLIPDLLVAQEKSIKAKRKDLVGMIKAWFDTVAFIAAKPDEAAQIMSKVVSLKPDEYKVFLPGTKFFDAAANTAALDGKSPQSLVTVAPTISSFLLTHKLIDGKPDAAKGVDASLLAEALK